MLLQCFLAFVIFLSSVLGHRCPAKSINYGEKCYKFNAERLTFYAAQRACAILGGNLASIQSQDVNTFLTEESIRYFIEQGDELDAWIGGEMPENSNQWKWNDNSEFKYANFKIPNFRPERAFLALNYETQQWNAYKSKNQESQKPYICQYSASSSSPSPLFPSTPQKSNYKDCPDPWVYFENFCYISSSIRELKYYQYHEREKFCLLNNAHLLSIHSQKEMDFVQNYTKQFEGLLPNVYANYGWIGLGVNSTQTNLQYTDGTEYDFDFGVLAYDPNTYFILNPTTVNEYRKTLGGRANDWYPALCKKPAFKYIK